LEARLRSRGLDAAEVIATRIGAAQNDMSHLEAFEYVMINQDFNTALQDLSHILFAARLRAPNMRAKHQALIQSLLPQQPTPTQHIQRP
jgi:guanylate kinase